MLVVPHQFDAVTYAPIRPSLQVWGALFLTAGSGVVLATTLPLRVPVIVAAHLLAAVAFLALAHGFTLAGSWTGTVTYGVFGLGTACSAFLIAIRPAASPARRPRDVFIGLTAVSACCHGLIMLAIPEQFSSARYDLIRPYLAVYGTAFLGGGVALLWTQFARWPRLALVWSAHLTVAAAMLASLPPLLEIRAWTGVAQYGGMGLFLAALPAMRPYLNRLDGRSLRMRLIIAFAVVAAVPLVLTVALLTERIETMAVTRVLAGRQTIVTALAQKIGSTARGETEAEQRIADDPTSLEISSNAQNQGSLAYLVAADGRVIARSDGRPIDDRTWQAPEPVISILQATESRSGSAVYATPRGEHFSVFARVPGVPWTVVVDQPEAMALANEHDGREQAFGLLVGTVVLAILGGIFATSQLARPLSVLSTALERLSDGDTEAPLPTSGVTELARLSTVFGRLRQRLAARTIERDRVERELRQTNDALEEAAARAERLAAAASIAVKAKGQFLANMSHEIQDADERRGRDEQAAAGHRVDRRAAGLRGDHSS